MKHGFLILVASAALSACASSRPTASPDTRVNPSHTSVTSVSAMDSQRDIVLAVANPLEPPTTNAGSNLLGYAASRYYGASQRAASILAALKQRYGLREVTGGPIKALELYCVVLKLPPGMARDVLLKALAKDDRVQLAEPLHDYSVYSEKSQQIAHKYNDPYVTLQRGFVETDAAEAQNFSQGNGVHIAIVDTGVEP